MKKREAKMPPALRELGAWLKAVGWTQQVGVPTHANALKY
jgi:hypothetical protein